MGKTDRILSYLPPAFRPDLPDPRTSVLFNVVDSVGQRLLEADNLLVEVMRAHWVDFADHRADQLRDLKLLAALYDLLPRDDEDVETFRTHLKSYVRTYLQGSATLRGVLRLAASTLALSIEDELEPEPGAAPYLVDLIHPGDDATFKLFGFKDAEAHGIAPAPARVVGGVDLSGGADLSGGSALLLAIDHDDFATVDLSGGESGAASLWEIARRINAALGVPIASHDGTTLILTSGVAGPRGEIQIGSPTGDAADAVLGAAPRLYQGADQRPAQVRGTVDHAPLGGIPLVDLRRERFLRLAVDGAAPVEVDCAGADTSATRLDTVVERINAATGAAVAAHDGHVLTLTSPTAGPASRLEVLPAPAQDARAILLGPQVRRVNRGARAAAARLVGRAVLNEGVDLSARRFLRLRLDGGAAQQIDCAGQDPSATLLPEIVTRINAAFTANVASQDGRRLTLTSPTSGGGSSVEVLEPSDPATDATALILGVAPRSYQGAPPGPAVLSGLVALEEPLDLRRQRRLWLSIDGGAPLVIDCAGKDPAHTTLLEVVDAINDAAGTTIVAPPQHGWLILQSPTAGATSALVLRAPETSVRRFFYTRGRVREDAATMLFGFASGAATGRLPEPARLTGALNLSRGVDLRVGHTLRLLIDDRDPVEIRIADPLRPRVTLLPDIIKRINTALAAPVASERGGLLELTSPAEGPEGRIAIGTSTASDAGPLLFGLPMGSESRGRAAEQVRFVGMADLARGLRVTDSSQLLIGIDGRPLTAIDLRAALPADSPPILSPAQIAQAINTALRGAYADHDGRHIILTSQKTGGESQLSIAPAAEHDATLAVFGLDQARDYVGQDATSAQLSGQADLSAPIDLTERRHLSLLIDGLLLADIDCAGKNPAQTTLKEIVERINQAAPRPIAGAFEERLLIFSPRSGATSSVVLGLSSAADARRLVLGDAPTVALGRAGQPALLAGTTKFTRPVDLGTRAVIRLRVDGGEVREIDCAGERPSQTFSGEVISRINAIFPGLAALDAQSRLVLSAARQVELLALRHFTIFEFAPVETRSPAVPLTYRATWSATNDSVRDEEAEWVLASLRGVDRPRLTQRDTRAWVQVNAVIPAGYTLHVRLDDEGRLRAWMDAPGRATHDLTDRLEAQPGPEVLRLPIGESRWRYSDCAGDRFNTAYFGTRPRRGRPRRLRVVPAHFAGGPICHTPAVFNLSRFSSDEQPDILTVFGARAAQLVPVATSSFVYRMHQAGRFELRLPADLPPQFGGRFNTARFAGSGMVYPAAIFDLPRDPRALDEQITARPGVVTAGVELFLDEGVPIYDVPFTNDRPLAGGSTTTYARAYLRQPGVPGAVELRANDIGAWGNAIVVSAPDSATPGAFDVSVSYTGRDVFENARAKVKTQIAQARAAGILAEVTRR